MFEQALQDDLSLLALPLYLAAVLLEAWYAHRHHLNRYRLGDTLASLSMLVASGIVELLPRLLALTAFVYLHEISPLRDVVGRQWWAWLLLFFLDDFTYYWFHRANHEVRLLWAGHVNHHSSQYLNFATALRQGVGERLHKFLFWMWLPLLGFDPAMIITVISLSRNHGGVLIVWDRLFGTFSEERDDDPVVYGLTTNIDSDNPWTVLSHEYRAIWRDLQQARNWDERLRTLFLAPGWSARGPDKRAAVLREQAGMH